MNDDEFVTSNDFFGKASRKNNSSSPATIQQDNYYPTSSPYADFVYPPVYTALRIYNDQTSIKGADQFLMNLAGEPSVNVCLEANPRHSMFLFCLSKDLNSIDSYLQNTKHCEFNPWFCKSKNIHKRLFLLDKVAYKTSNDDQNKNVNNANNKEK